MSVLMQYVDFCLQAYAPELYLLEATPEVRQAIAASSEGSTRPQTRTSYEYDYPATNRQSEYPSLHLLIYDMYLIKHSITSILIALFSFTGTCHHFLCFLRHKSFFNVLEVVKLILYR